MARGTLNFLNVSGRLANVNVIDLIVWRDDALWLIRGLIRSPEKEF